MNSSIYKITLDLHSTQSQIVVPTSVGDVSRAFYISLSDGGMPYIIDDRCMAALVIKRPTDKNLTEFCSIGGNVIRYHFSQNENTCAVEGVHDCQIILYDIDGKPIASPRFTMLVSSKVVNKDDLDLSDENEFSLNAIVEAEAARKLAEEARVAAEDKRKVTADKLEAMFKGSSQLVTVELPASAWAGEESPYSQVVHIEGVTAYTKVDLQPDIEQLAIFHEKDIAFVTENEDGIVTVYAIGDKPTNDYSIQATITEVII